MTPEELPGVLAAIRDRASAAAADAANAMAFAEQRYLVTDVLARYSHPPFTKTPSPPGEPPAIVTGTLRRSVRPEPAHGGPTATAFLAPHTVYARIQEVGGDIVPVRRQYLRWFSVTPQGQGFGYVPRGIGRTAPKGMPVYPIFAKRVKLPARPYMRPARDDLVASGAFHRKAAGVFEAAMWG